MTSVDDFFDNVQTRADNGDVPTMAEYGMLAIAALLTAPDDEDVLFDTAINVALPFMGEVSAKSDVGQIFTIAIAARFEKPPKEIMAKMIKIFKERTGLTDEEIKEAARDNG